VRARLCIVIGAAAALSGPNICYEVCLLSRLRPISPFSVVRGFTCDTTQLSWTALLVLYLVLEKGSGMVVSCP